VLRTLDTPDDLARLSALFVEVFGDPIPSVIDMRGSLLAGGVCIGAFEGEQLVGGLWSFAGWDEDGPFQHSHTLCVRPDAQGGGIGRTLKSFHADWCREHDIDRIRWTFDPLMVDNARFNLNVIGALGDRWIEDCYGAMPGKLDPAGRTGRSAPSDRLSVTLHLRHPVAETDARPTMVPIPPTGDAPDAIPVRDAVDRLREDLEPLIDGGAFVVGVQRHNGPWAYRVERPQGE
jgi:predicted GNAT superfamily acetyltransferase